MSNNSTCKVDDVRLPGQVRADVAAVQQILPQVARQCRGWGAPWYRGILGRCEMRSIFSLVLFDCSQSPVYTQVLPQVGRQRCRGRLPWHSAVLGRCHK